jgi:hypothetical protein
MGHSTTGFRVLDSVGLGLGFGAMVLVAGAAFGDRVVDVKPTDARPTCETIGEIHRLTLPVIQVAAPACEAEMAAYALAVTRLRAAQASAEEAYAAWYRCELGSNPPPDTPGGEPPAKFVSILEQ